MSSKELSMDQPFLKPAFDGDAIPVAFAASDGFVPYFAGCLQSLLDHISPGNCYDLVLIQTDVTGENQARLKTMVSAYSNVSLRFFHAGKLLENGRLKANAHISVETYFRFLIQQILPDYDNFVASGKHYSDDAAHINGQMIDYAERSNTILSMVSQMVDSINGITEAVDEGANGVSSVADSIQTLVSEISVINTKMSENQEIAGSLQDEAKRFQA